MAGSPIRTSNVVPLGERRPSSRDLLDSDKKDLQAARSEMEEQRRALDDERKSFDEDLAVLEEQRRFLATQRESVRAEAAALQERWRDVRREKEAVEAKAVELSRLEQLLGETLQKAEAERAMLQKELARLRERGA